MPSKLARNLADNVKRHMEALGWSQRGLAKRAGVSQRGVGYVLAYSDGQDRHASLDTVEAIAAALKVPSTTLLAPASARLLHGVGEQGAPYAEPPRAGHGMDDAELLAFVIEQAEGLPKFSQLSGAQRAQIIAKAYAAVAADARKPTAARVLRLLRSA